MTLDSYHQALLKSKNKGVCDRSSIHLGYVKNRCIRKFQEWRRYVENRERKYGYNVKMDLAEINIQELGWIVARLCPCPVFRRVCRVANKRLLAPSCPSLRPSVIKKQLICNWTGFREIWYCGIFQKFVNRIQVSLKSDKNNGYFPWRLMFTFGNVSPNSS
jgi:hypothetical protein